MVMMLTTTVLATSMAQSLPERCSLGSLSTVSSFGYGRLSQRCQNASVSSCGDRWAVIAVLLYPLSLTPAGAKWSNPCSAFIIITGFFAPFHDRRMLGSCAITNGESLSLEVL